MLRYGIFPTVSDIKISATHFEKRCGRCLHGSRQELQFFRPAVVKFTQMFISSPEHHPTLLPFLPLMLDPASQRIYYQHRSHPRASQVARLRSQMVWHLCIVSIVRGDAFIQDLATGQAWNIILNKWMMHLYSACVLLYTQSTFTIMWVGRGGTLPEPPPVCSIHLDDTTAATGQRRQCTHQLQVERRERHRTNQVYALTTHQLQVERRESHRVNQVYALTTHQLQVERRESHRANQVYALTTHQLQVERRESHRDNQVYALTTHQLQVREERESHRDDQVYALTHTPATGGEEERESHKANQVYALTTHQLQGRGERDIETIKCMRSPHTSYRWRGERDIETIKCMLSPHTSYRWRGERDRDNQVYALTTHQLQVERRESHRDNQVYALTTHQLQVERRERQRRSSVCAHHTPATGGEERESHRANQVYALTTHQLQVERRERVIEPIKCMRSPHTSYRWRGERDIETIKCMRSPHTSYRWRGERVIETIKCMRSPPHQLQVERRESHRANQVNGDY